MRCKSERMSYIARSPGAAYRNRSSCKNQDGAVTETINFQGPTRLNSADTEVSAYAEDRWTLNKVLSLTFGARLTHQSNGRNLAIAPRAGLAYSLAGGKLVIRAGAGLIYGHIPLLAADFAQNQERVITFSSGPFVGEPITLQNVYRFGGSSMNSASLEDSSSSPRTLTWNIEGDASLRKNIDLRFGYFETHSINLFVADPILPVTGTSGFLALENTGSANLPTGADDRSLPSHRGGRAEFFIHMEPGAWRPEYNFQHFLFRFPFRVIRSGTLFMESSLRTFPTVCLLGATLLSPRSSYSAL